MVTCTHANYRLLSSIRTSCRMNAGEGWSPEEEEDPSDQTSVQPESVVKGVGLEPSQASNHKQKTCEHGLRRTRCFICGGGSFCQHSKRRDSCRLCKVERKRDTVMCKVIDQIIDLDQPPPKRRGSAGIVLADNTSGSVASTAPPHPPTSPTPRPELGGKTAGGSADVICLVVLPSTEQGDGPKGPVLVAAPVPQLAPPPVFNGNSADSTARCSTEADPVTAGIQLGLPSIPSASPPPHSLPPSPLWLPPAVSSSKSATVSPLRDAEASAQAEPKSSAPKKQHNKICWHGVRSTRCPACGGGSLCHHIRRRDTCTLCKANFQCSLDIITRAVSTPAPSDSPYFVVEPSQADRRQKPTLAYPPATAPASESGWGEVGWGQVG